MLASRQAQVVALNRLARCRLRAAGGLETEEMTAGGRSFAVGDAVVAGRNDYRLGLLNGTRGTVTAVDLRRGRVQVATTTEGRTVDSPTSTSPLATSLTATPLPCTRHRAPRSTPPCCWWTISPSGRRPTRGEVANRVYVVSDAADALQIHAPRRDQPDEHATLRRAVQRSAAQELATPKPQRAPALGL